MSKIIKYLGTVLSNVSGSPDVESRITAAQKAFYSLQGGGLMFNSVNPETAINMYCMAVKSVLMSRCSATQLSKDLLCKLDKTQGKAVVGLSNYGGPLVSFPTFFPYFCLRNFFFLFTRLFFCLRNCLFVCLRSFFSPDLLFN